jgi:hypothetical protein
MICRIANAFFQAEPLRTSDFLSFGHPIKGGYGPIDRS